MKLSLVLVAGLLCATSVFGKVTMPKELIGVYYSNEKEKASECMGDMEGSLNIEKDGTSNIMSGCSPTKISSSKNGEYKITLKCGDEEGGSYKETNVYKRVKNKLLIDGKVVYKSCK